MAAAAVNKRESLGRRKIGTTGGGSQERVGTVAPEIDKTIDNFVETTLEMGMYLSPFYLIKDKGVEGIRKQFHEIAAYHAPDAMYKYTAFAANPAKNRYNDVVCLDRTRVILRQDVPPLSGYIHANWVKFEKHDKEFIATQGPLEDTVGDFWRMVLQEQCPSIVNLTKVCNTISYLKQQY
ncbi:unnamed protein product [Nippostrongylus brasiliensis]|uniref:Tyrosine-protein phosphatase domain-containing protein n=1 Tax=Nippostrongylus brasiliensis TaxID=27835 RepID=A0A0N4YBJ1_NIPBR|nr:unnamed protein product [Nippostrongylus brasiliensis]